MRVLSGKKSEADRINDPPHVHMIELLLLGSSLIHSSGQARLMTRGGVAM